jgi:hydroxymethylbilane synthase
MSTPIRIGTRESRLAVWQASEVQKHLLQHGYSSELVFIKSEGDINLTTPLYEMGVQGIFTRALDIALLNRQIDVAVHSMKDVPTQLPKGIVQAAVLKRGAVKDLLVFRGNANFVKDFSSRANIATSSIRRRAQWLHRYPNHTMYNLRGNMQTRLEKLNTENWDGAIFAQAGLERIDLRPENSIELDWMLPAPAQGAVVVVGRDGDEKVLSACKMFNDRETALCTNIERSFLRGVLGGCSTPVSAYAKVEENKIHFRANMFSPDGKHKVEVEKWRMLVDSEDLGEICAREALENGGVEINEMIKQQLGKYPSS